MFRLSFVVASFVVLTGPSPATAQDTVAVERHPDGLIVGRVVNAITGAGIEGAVVELVETVVTTTSGSTGEFRFARVVPGGYRLRVRAIGFRPVVRSDLLVGSGRPLEVVIPLNPVPIELDTILVRPDYFVVDPIAPVSAFRIEGVEVLRAPGVQQDVVRAVALLPGVGVTTAGRNDLIVRGGAPYENLFLIDGIEVPNINHFGSQGSTGGPLSLLPVDVVNQVSFASGGFGVRYGDRTGSVTSIRIRNPATTRWTGLLDLSATGFGAIVEGPIGDRASLLVAVRRSYLDLLFKAAGFSFVPSYWDGQVKANWRMSDRNQLNFLFVGALDDVWFDNSTPDNRFDNSRILAPDQNQYFAGLGWTHYLRNGVFELGAGRTHVRFRSVQQDSLVPPQPVFANISTEAETALRGLLTLQLSPRTSLEIGNTLKYADQLSYDLALAGALRRDQAGQPAPLRVDTTFTALRNATFATVGLTSGRQWQFTAGLRLSYYGSFATTWTLDPRATIRYAPTPASAFTLAVGRYHQSPSFIWLVGDPANPATLVPIQSDQVILGYQRLVRPELRFQIEGFYRRYTHYPARVFRPQAVLAPSGFEDATTDIPFGLEPLTSTGSGRTFGVEAFAQKRFSDTPWFGLVSLTLARAEFMALDGVTRSGAYDTRFIGTVGGAYRPNARWEFSAKWRVATGLPTTPYITAGPDAGMLDFARYNQGPRLPAFHALDVRVDRRWSWQGVQLDAYIDIQNLYSRTNVSAFRWNERDQAVEADESLGILPTIGILLEF